MTTDTKPLPRINPDNAPFWEAAQEHRLRLPRCLSCRAWYWPPGPVCPTCFSDRIGWRTVRGRGVVASWTVVHQAWFASFADDIPYAVAQVELAEGPRLTAALVDIAPEAIRVGLPVAVVFDDVTEAVTLPKFRPCAPRER